VHAAGCVTDIYRASQGSTEPSFRADTAQEKAPRPQERTFRDSLDALGAVEQGFGCIGHGKV
jgi:hypothetical protein